MDHLTRTRRLLLAQAETVVRLGVDLGQANDFSAVIATEQRRGDDGQPSYVVRHIERLPLGVPFPQQAERIEGVYRSLERRAAQRLARGEPGFRLQLLVDRTGLGRPVVDMLKARGVRPVGVTLTAGDGLTDGADDVLNVGKQRLIDRLQLLLGTGRLAIPNTEDGRMLRDELATMEATQGASGRVRYGASAGNHDDLVVALGLSVGFQAERQGKRQALFGVRSARGTW